MFQPNSFRRHSFSQHSSQSFEFEDFSKENTDIQPKGVADLNPDLNTALTKIIARPKFIEQIELKCSINTFPTYKIEHKEIRETEFAEDFLQKLIETRNQVSHYPLKIKSSSDLTEQKSESFPSSNELIQGKGYKKAKTSIGNEDLACSTKSQVPRRSIIRKKGVTLNKGLLAQLKKISTKGKLSMWFAPRSLEQINQCAINLIHDKAFGLYEDENKVGKKRISIRKKQGQLFSIIKKHVDKHRLSRVNSFWTIMRQLKEMQPNPVQWKLIRFLKRISTSVKRLAVRLKNFVKSWIYPFNPDSLFILAWEAIIIILVFFDLFLLPFTFAFEDDMDNIAESFIIIDTIQFSLYLLNIFINLHTSYYDKEGYLISSRKKIIINYLRGYFGIDILSSFPYSWTIKNRDGPEIIDQSFKFIRLLRFLRIIRVFKVFRSNRILKKIEQNDYFNPLVMGILSLLKLSLTVACLAHFCACFWYFLGTTDFFNSWLERAHLDGAEIEERYIASLYFTITTMLTVGYGDISPLSLRERAFGICLMIIGGGLFGYSMTRISEILKALEHEESKKKYNYLKRVKAVAIYMHKKGLNKDIQQLVKKYLAFVQENEDKTWLEDRDSLSILSKNLKDQISKQINRKFIKESPIFRDLFTQKLKNLVPLHLEEIIVSPGEVIYSQDDTDYSLYMLSKGKVHLHYENFTRPLAILENKSYFGVESFFTGESRVIQATSVEFSHLIYITRSKFLELLENRSVDRETFATIKDKAILYNDYSGLFIQCHVCKKNDHMTSCCPEAHFVANKEQTIKNYLIEQKNFKESFLRGDRKQFRARRNLQSLKSRAHWLQKVHGIRDQSSYKDDDMRESEELESADIRNDIEEPKESLFKLEAMSEISLDKNGTIRKVAFKHSRLEELPVKLDFLSINKVITIPNLHSSEAYSGEKYIEEIEFDRIKNFEIYFSHNNLAKILAKPRQKINFRSKSRIHFGTKHEGQQLLERMRKVFSIVGKNRKKPGSLSPISLNSTMRRKSEGAIPGIKFTSISIYKDFYKS